MTAFGVIIAIVSAITAAFAVWYAYQAVKAAERASEVQIVKSFMDDYGEDEVLKAMRRLRDWQWLHRDAFARVFAEKLSGNYDEVAPIDQARRRVSHYFQKVHRLHVAKLLNMRIVNAVAGRGQASYYLEVIEPLEEALSADYDQSSFEWFAGCYRLGRSPLLMQPRKAASIASSVDENVVSDDRADSIVLPLGPGRDATDGAGAK